MTLNKIFAFSYLPYCSYAAVVFWWAIRPSIHPTHELWQNKRNFWSHFYTVWKVDASSLWHEQRLMGDGPFYLQFWAKLTHSFKQCRHSLVFIQL